MTKIRRLTGDGIPRPKLGKTHKDNRWVRFVELNRYVDDIIKYINDKLTSGGGGSGDLKSFEITLDKAQINDLHNTPITFTAEDMGVESGKAALFEHILIVIDQDDTPFVEENKTLQNAIYDLDKEYVDPGGKSLVIVLSNTDTTITQTVPTIPTNFKESVLPTTFGPGFGLGLINEDVYSIQSSDEIGGGGPNSYIKFRLFFKEVELT